MKRLLYCLSVVLLLAACQNTQNETGSPSVTGGDGAFCAEALIRYAERYPAAEPIDLYKLVFQDLYGPGHLLADTAAARRYISREAEAMPDSTAFPAYEYTLCDSHFVRVNLLIVKHGTMTVEQLASAVIRSAEGLPVPNPKYVLSHSAAFKEAYQPHYRIVRRDIFEREILPQL